MIRKYGGLLFKYGNDRGAWEGLKDLHFSWDRCKKQEHTCEFLLELAAPFLVQDSVEMK
jgi:hypothetical protein